MLEVIQGVGSWSAWLIQKTITFNHQFADVLYRELKNIEELPGLPPTVNIAGR